MAVKVHNPPSHSSLGVNEPVFKIPEVPKLKSSKVSLEAVKVLSCKQIDSTSNILQEINKGADSNNEKKGKGRGFFNLFKSKKEHKIIKEDKENIPIGQEEFVRNGSKSRSFGAGQYNAVCSTGIFIYFCFIPV